MAVIKEFYDQYYDALYDTDRDKALEVIDEAGKEGVSPEDIVFDIVLPAIEQMLSGLVEDQGISLSQHYICSKVSSEITDKLLPLFSTKHEMKGTVLLGTARGDFHGLGKKIVGGCLTANMYKVHDLGINVPAEKFVDEALRLNAQVIGISSMMVHTAVGEEGASRVRKILKERGLEEKIKLIVGGAPYRFDRALYKRVGADGWADNAMEVVGVVDRLIKEVTAHDL